MLKGLFCCMILSWSLGGSWCLDVCKDQVEGARLAHPADCSRFIICRAGVTAQIRYCPFGLHFNRFDAICDLQYRAGCNVRYSGRISQFLDYEDPKRIDCDMCQAVCSTGKLPGTKSQIPPADKPAKAPCNKPEKPPTTPCPTPPTPKPTTRCPSTLPTATSTKPCRPPTPPTPPSTKPPPPSTKPCRPTKPPTPSTIDPDAPQTGPSGLTCADHGKCEGKHDGALFADNSSTGYIICQCQCEILMPCPPNLIFNEAKQTCDWPQV